MARRPARTQTGRLQSVGNAARCVPGPRDQCAHLADRTLAAVLGFRRRLGDDPPVRLLRDPVRRGSPVVALRHYPAYAVALALGTAALAVSVLSGRTFLDAADVALVHSQLDAVPVTASAGEQGRVRASVSDGSPARVEDAITREMDGMAGGGAPVEIRRPVAYLDPRTKPSPYIVNPATGERTPGALFAATGALDALAPAPGSPTPTATGLWLPD